MLGLTRKHPRERVLAAVTEAHAHQHFRYQTIRQLVERTPARAATDRSVTDDPAIRPMTQYTLEDFLSMNPQLTTRLRHLRLSGMVDALPGRVAQAEAAPLPHLEFLELLVEDELARRADRLFARRLKQAGITVDEDARRLRLDLQCRRCPRRRSSNSPPRASSRRTAACC